MERLRTGGDEPWDVAVVGGGATGLGAALEAASRGYRTVLVEEEDFGKGTSSRSTKLIHGGVRYLREGDLDLVFEALRERSRLLRNAPHVVHERRFVVPAYRWWEKPWYGLGLKLYDLLAGARGIASSRWLSRERTLDLLPTLRPSGLRGGVLYHDGQFHDTRLAITLAMSVLEHGGIAVNHLRCESFLRGRGGRIRGIVARDLEAGSTVHIRARAVVNATGPLSDRLRRMDDRSARSIIEASRGTHVVLDRAHLPGDTALLVPRTRDGRVLFVIPWQGRVLAGTTEVPVDEPTPDPDPTASEVEYILSHAGRYLDPSPGPGDVLSAFAGLRPLVGGGEDGEEEEDTAQLSREHRILVSESGLVTVAGGKWTTFREMGEDTVDRVEEELGLSHRPSRTAALRLHGWTETDRGSSPWRLYGANAPRLRRLATEDPELAERLHPRLPYRAVQVVWAARHEMARTVEDVLARRTSALFLDARAAGEAAGTTARLLARELGRGPGWRSEQVEAFRARARASLP